MLLNTKTIEILENKQLCEKVMSDFRKGYNKEYLKRKYGISRRHIEQIIKTYKEQEQ